VWCKALSNLGFHHKELYFMDDGDYLDASLSKVLQFFRSVGLLEANQKGKHNRQNTVTM
jgi:hypothetical protein